MSNQIAKGFSPNRSESGEKQPAMAARSSVSVFRNVLVEGASSGNLSSCLLHPSSKVLIVIKNIFFITYRLKFKIQSDIERFYLWVIGTIAGGRDFGIPAFPEIIERKQIFTRDVQTGFLDTHAFGYRCRQGIS